MPWTSSYVNMGTKRLVVTANIAALVCIAMLALHKSDDISNYGPGSKYWEDALADAAEERARVYAQNTPVKNANPQVTDNTVGLVSPPSSNLDASTGYPMVQWGPDGDIPQTSMVVHKPGFSLIDNIYMANKTYFIVSDVPSSFPPVNKIINNGKELEYDASEREPTDEDIQIISTAKARALFGEGAIHLPGVSFSTNEPPQFMTHYYHLICETILGLWRIYTSLDSNLTPSGRTSLAPVRRFIFPHAPKGEWRDRAKMSQFVLAAAFPNAPVLGQEEWEDLAETGRPYLLERLAVTERGCVDRMNPVWEIGKMAAVAFLVPGSPHFWAPIRRNVLSFIGMTDKEILYPSSNSVITYISRQKTGRRLIEEDHEKLVTALRQMEKDYGWEVNIPVMENLNRAEQIRLAGRTTIMMGVHGNGLTHQLWMPSTPRSTVFEFFYPGGFVLDYAWPAQVLGHTHYGFWNDTHFTSPNNPERVQPEGFHGSSIIIDADAVVKLCIEILGDDSSAF